MDATGKAALLAETRITHSKEGYLISLQWMKVVKYSRRRLHFSSNLFENKK
jgi:hypothetical protein